MQDSLCNIQPSFKPAEMLSERACIWWNDIAIKSSSHQQHHLNSPPMSSRFVEKYDSLPAIICMDNIKLNDLDRKEEEDDFLDRIDWLTYQGERSKLIEKFFVNEEDYYNARSIAFLIWSHSPIGTRLYNQFHKMANGWKGIQKGRPFLSITILHTK